MPGDAIGWWRDEAVIHRFVCDIIASGLAASRPTTLIGPPPPWNATLHLARDLGADSLELLALASALAEAIHLHESGIEDRLLIRPTIGEWVATAQAGLETFSAAMTFRTSGSADDPKRCTHALSTLWQEVEHLAPLFAGRGRVLSAVRSHHIYGFLFTALLPRALAVPGASLVDLRGSAPSSLLAQLRDGDLVIAYPDYWHAVARVATRMPSGVIGVTSTAPCPDHVAVALSAAGLNTLVQIYGSSETAGVGLRTDPREPYSLFAFWHRDENQAGDIVRVAPDGQHTAYALQDRMAWIGDRQFRPQGRIDHALQVAGVNVHPARVRRVLMEHPDVLDAAVRRMHADDCSRLKAFVVPRAERADDALLQAELEDFVSSRLTAPERPRAFSFGPSIPVDASGKRADWHVVPAQVR